MGLLRIAVLLVSAAAAIYAQRNLGFYALAFYLVHSGYRAERPLLLSRLHFRATLRRRLESWLPAVSVLGAMTVAAFWIPALAGDSFYLAEGVSRRSGGGVTPALFSLETAADLPRLTGVPSAAVFNNIDAASSLLAAGTARVFVDGRTEAYPADVWRLYLAIRRGDAEALSRLDSVGPAAVVIGHHSASGRRLVRTLLESDRWRLASADEATVVFLPGGPGSATGGMSAGPDAVLATGLRRVEARLARIGGTRGADICLAYGDLLNRRDPLRAESLYRRGLALRADHPLLNHNLGNLLLAQQRHDEALPLFRRALERNRHQAESIVNEGICLFRLGRTVEAEASFARAVGRDGTVAEAWVNLAELKRRRGDRAGALAAYQRARELLPRDERLLRRIQEFRAGAR